MSNMFVKKRNGSLEEVDIQKIVNSVSNAATGVPDVDVMTVAVKTIGSLHNGATTRELDELAIRTSANLISKDPNYTFLASNLLMAYIEKEARMSGVTDVHTYLDVCFSNGLISSKLVSAIKSGASYQWLVDDYTNHFKYFGLKTLYDRYLLRHPVTRMVVETPALFFLRIAVGVGPSPKMDASDFGGEAVSNRIDFSQESSLVVEETEALYKSLSNLEFLFGTPTLFNAGTPRSQMSSCYVQDSPQDSIEGIFKSLGDVALESKFSAGIGMDFSRIRSRHSLIKGTNGKSNGVVPFLKIFDSTIACVDQGGGKRKGSLAGYLQTWHGDIEEFLEIKNNTGDQAARTHNLNSANWIPDLFMQAVESGDDWHLFDPSVVPCFTDLYGEAFNEAYRAAVAGGMFVKKVPARDLYLKMMKTIAETGNGWLCFKDTANKLSNITGNGRVIHSSNLCTEIFIPNDKDNTSVCNLASPNLAKLKNWEDMERVIPLIVRALDRVIDRNFYPTPEARNSNMRFRPIGLGQMGLQDLFLEEGLAFDSPEALELSTSVSKLIEIIANEASVKLAEEKGPYAEWESSRDKVRKRNSLLIAIAPTATISDLAGCFPSIEPQISNISKKETLSGDFVVVNEYLVEDLKKLNLWNDDIKAQIKLGEGSIQHIQEIPEEIRVLYKTVWEISGKTLINLAAARQPFIDQGQSLNLFMENPNIGALSSMYMYAWKSGLKSTYYLRSRPATKIKKATVLAAKPEVTEEEAIMCSLENPEACESCQ